jgi:hypothetical protein
MLTYFGLIFAGGLVGGGMAAWILSDRTLLPSREPLPRGRPVLRPGLVGSALAGAVAAVGVAVLYGLAGPSGLGISMYSAPLGAILVGLSVGGVLGCRARQQFLAAARDEAVRTAILLLGVESEQAEQPHRP